MQNRGHSLFLRTDRRGVDGGENPADGVSWQAKGLSAFQHRCHYLVPSGGLHDGDAVLLLVATDLAADGLAVCEKGKERFVNIINSRSQRIDHLPVGRVIGVLATQTEAAGPSRRRTSAATAVPPLSPGRSPTRNLRWQFIPPPITTKSATATARSISPFLRSRRPLPGLSKTAWRPLSPRCRPTVPFISATSAAFWVSR